MQPLWDSHGALLLHEYMAVFTILSDKISLFPDTVSLDDGSEDREPYCLPNFCRQVRLGHQF